MKGEFMATQSEQSHPKFNVWAIAFLIPRSS